MILLLLPKVMVAAVVVSSTTTHKLQFRWGRAQDPWTIALSQIRNLQVPSLLLLGLKQQEVNNLLVMETVDTNNNTNNKTVIIGWAQIRPIGYAERDPSRFDSRPGSYDIEVDVDDQMWQEFEEDTDSVVPTGWASLPWTSEYRAMEAGIQQRQVRRVELVQEALKERRATQIPSWELASFFVDPVYRCDRAEQEGMTLVEQALLQKLCEEFQQESSRAKGNTAKTRRRRRLCDLYLVTSRPESFEPFGFEKVTETQQVPIQLSIRNNNGRVCMRGKEEI
jgi:hypothetical protein